jgi:hypothetical protein
VSAVVSRNNFQNKSSFTFNARISGSRLIVSNNMPNLTNGGVSLFDISGKCIATQKGNKEIVFDISNIAKGTYFVRLSLAKGNQKVMKFFK